MKEVWDTVFSSDLEWSFLDVEVLGEHFEMVGLVIDDAGDVSS
jgi:hypothetical protein